jgi:hypothetical protein
LKISLFLLANFEKLLAATGRISKEFHANQGKVSTSGKEGIKKIHKKIMYTLSIFKILGKFKSFRRYAAKNLYLEIKESLRSTK